jgi:hypothetical protein
MSKKGKNTADPNKTAHQVAMYFSPACLSNKFQVTCRMAEPSKREMAMIGMMVSRD